MLTRLEVRNFKRLANVAFDLDKSVVLIGPNNSGKTTALQALALWEVGLHQWNAKRGGKASPEKRPGVTINRRDLISIPVPQTNLLWSSAHVRDVAQQNGRAKKTQNVRIDVVVHGITQDLPWLCGLEFDYSNEESFVCRPIRMPGYETKAVKDAKFTTLPPEASQVRIAYLPPMSGLAATEPKWEPGRVNVLLGEGQTAQVLRNLCLQIYQKPDHTEWDDLCKRIEQLFGARLLPPEFIRERGEITMQYEERRVTLDLSASGRGLQQTMLLLAHLYANPETVLLLDEPDAHLEILRQRQTYQLITEVAEARGSQVIAASHSEVMLSEAADRGMVIAFVGEPHRLNDRDRGSQVCKALTEIGWDQYYQAEQTGWVLYVEGPSDLAILRVFAKTLGHDAQTYLERPFVHYLGNNVPSGARKHFNGIKEAKADLVGIAIFDRIDAPLQQERGLAEAMWRSREIESYFCTPQVLEAYASKSGPGDLFQPSHVQAMQEAIQEVSRALQDLNRGSPWSPDTKVSDDFLDPLFRKYFSKTNLPLGLRKAEYHTLAGLVPRDQISPEIVEKLDAIVQVASQAKPAAC